MVERLTEIGMGLAEALLRQVNEPGAPVVANDMALAYSRIARGVRLTIVLAQRIEAEPAPRASFWDAGVTAARCAAALSVPTGAAAARDASSAPPDEITPSEVEQGETGREGGAERLLAALDARLDHEADEAAWLERPLTDLAAQICRDLGVPFDAAVWEDGETGNAPRAVSNSAHPRDCEAEARSSQCGDPGFLTSSAGGAEKSLDPRLRGDERVFVDAGQFQDRPPRAANTASPPPSVIGKDAIIAAIRKHQPP
jgi:hypothetical protein